MSTAQLRVLEVTARYLPFMGGVELHVDEVARRLARRGVDVTILTTDPTATLPVHEHVDGVAVRRVRAGRPRRTTTSRRTSTAEIRRGQWDVVHVHAYHTFVGPLAMSAAVRSGLPFVLTFHAGGHSSRLRNAIRPYQVAVLRPLLARKDCSHRSGPFRDPSVLEESAPPRKAGSLSSPTAAICHVRQ